MGSRKTLEECMKYVLLNLVVLAALAVALAVTRVRIPWRNAAFVLGVMLLLTLVFDNIIIGVGFVAYDPAFISGVKAWLAPIEDFGYTIAAVMVVILLW